MNLRSRINVESRKQAAEAALAAHLVLLRAKDFDDRAIERNTKAREIRAAIRTATKRLNRIAAIETENVSRVQAKADRAAAKKSAKEKGSAQRATGGAEAKKPKKEKKEKQAKPAPDVSAAAPEARAPADEAPTTDSKEPAADAEVQE